MRIAEMLFTLPQQAKRAKKGCEREEYTAKQHAHVFFDMHLSCVNLTIVVLHLFHTLVIGVMNSSSQISMVR